MESSIHLFECSLMEAAKCFALWAVSPSIKSAMMAKDSASRSVTAPMRESLMDSSVVTSLSPVEMVDVQSVMVRLAALWQLWIFCMAVKFELWLWDALVGAGAYTHGDMMLWWYYISSERILSRFSFRVRISKAIIWQSIIQYLLPIDHRLVFKSNICRVGLVIMERCCRMTRRRLSLPLYVSVLRE